MAKFGKKLRQRKIKEWEQHYIDYKQLKHFIKLNNDPSKSLSIKYYLKINSKFKRSQARSTSPNVQ
jgi:SPX domain protein involved in polyphosphate accumulation